jgi:hypothetical protein
MPISKHDKQALADLFINMGVPLVVAMQTVESWSGGEDEPLPQRAEKLSKLLNISVEFATKITKKLEIRDAYTLENVRGKIIRIVTPIIAEGYVSGGEVPTEESLNDLTDLFDVLISFAESVSPTDEKGSKPTKMATMIEACEPILSAILADDKGLGAEKAFQESVAGLKARAEQLAPKLGLEHAIESGLFKSLVSIYVTCYKANDNIDAIWKSCDERFAIIQGLTAFVAEKANIKTDAPVTAAPESKATSPVKEEKKAEEPETKPDDKNDDDDDDGDFNPMSFFSAGG